MFLITLPLTCYHINLYVKRQHLVDVTEVFSVLNAEKKFRLAKLAFYLVLLIITIFRFVMPLKLHMLICYALVLDPYCLTSCLNV
ncbi:hypothetical protein TanjilG_26800 [Lupinus angustifolius]|uniref:Uncharacterized protein n=1 Tax=Lupinus angustifolius TaxID=3871 RepID=A0A4P1RI72_LUPAN|nr:hypothetical protein TanjilG_26800 [Lupinus angustifolius]